MPSLQEAHLRHAKHYKSILQRANSLYLVGGDSLTQGLSIFDWEWANIRKALDWAGSYTAKDSATASLFCAFMGSGSHLLNLRLHPLDGILWLNLGLTATRDLVRDRLMECQFLSGLGIAYLRIRAARRAVKYFQDSLTIAKELKNAYAAAIAGGNLGNAYFQLGDVSRAIEWFKYDLNVCKQLGDFREVGEAFVNLGNAYSLTGNFAPAVDCFQSALTISRKCGARQHEASALGNLGTLCRHSGEVSQALTYHWEALSIFRALGDRVGQSNSSGNLGLAYADLGEHDNALRFYDEQLTIATEISDPRGQATAHYNSSLVLHRVGHLSLALDRAVTAQNIYEEIEDAYALQKVRAKLAAWANEDY